MPTIPTEEMKLREALEKAKLAVRDEVGSQLCRWTSFGKRVCDVLSEGPCLCRDAARAALAAGSAVSPTPEAGTGEKGEEGK